MGIPLDELVIVSGGANGADAAAARWAKAANVPLVEHRPDWNFYGRSAGFKRNRLIIEEADFVLAFQRSRSKGTQHSIDLAWKMGTPVILWTS